MKTPTKLTERQRTALLLIQANGESMAWPATFGKAFWPDWGKWTMTHDDGSTTEYRHERRNKVNAPTMHYRAAGYLGRLRAAGLIEGGYYERRPSGGYNRAPLWLTDLARKLLKQA